jgi:hypothetical protein
MRTLIHADVIRDDQRGLVFQFVPSEFRRFGLELTNMLVRNGLEGPKASGSVIVSFGCFGIPSFDARTAERPARNEAADR